MTAAEIAAYLTQSFPDAQSTTVGAGTFFFFRDQRMMPVATLVSGDEFDQA